MRSGVVSAPDLRCALHTSNRRIAEGLSNKQIVTNWGVRAAAGVGVEGSRTSLIAQHTKVNLLEGLRPLSGADAAVTKICQKSKNLQNLRSDLHEKRPATRGGSRMRTRYSALCTPWGQCWERESRGDPGGRLRLHKPHGTNFFNFQFRRFFGDSAP